MATSQRLKDIIELYKKQNAGEVSKKYDPEKQSEGYKKRMEGSGIDVDKALDKRNLVEKLLNLPQDQNPLFDFFEILNRPQQAIFGAINASQKGEDVGEGALKGIKGDELVRFKHILQTAGLGEKDGKMGIDDVLGLVGDVVLDPVNFALLPVSAASKAAKAAKIADAAADVSKLSIGLNVNKSISSIGGVIDANMAIEAAQKTLEATKNIKLYRKSIAGVAMRGVGSGFKGAFRLADSGISGALKLIDSNTATVLGRLGKTSTSAQLTSLAHYTNIKDLFVNTFDAAKKLPAGLYNKAVSISGKKQFVQDAMLSKVKKYYGITDDLIKDVAVKNGLTVQETREYLMSIYEGGEELFGAGGKITLKGLNKKTSFGAMMKDEGLLVQSGLPKANAETLEIFIKENLPDWYHQNTSEGQELFTSIADKTGIVKDTYRIKNSETFQSLKQEFSNIADDDIMVKSKAVNIPDETLEKIKVNRQNLSHIEEYKLAGKNKAIPFGSDAHKTILAKRGELLMVQNNEIPKLTKVLQKLTDKGGTPETIKKAADSLTEAGKKATKLEKAILRLEDTQGVDISKLEYNALMEKKVLDKATADIPSVLGKDVIKKAYPVKLVDGKLVEDVDRLVTIDHYYSDSQLAKLEKFAQTEEVPEILGHIHTFMNESMQVLKKELGLADSFKYTSGYLPHKLSEEWRNYGIDKFTGTSDNWATTKGVIGNTKAFASRRYKMSAMEANGVSKSYIDYLVSTKSLTGDLAEAAKSGKLANMFAADINTSMADFISKAPRAAADANMLNYVLGKSLLDESSGSIILKDKVANMLVPPRGYTRVTTETLQLKIDAMSKYVNDEGQLAEVAKEWLANNSGKEIFINNNINHLIGRITEQKGVNSAVAFIDSITNMFKKNKLLSFGFQLRNLVGNFSNMWLSGMDIDDILKYSSRSRKILKHGDELFDIVQTGSRTLTVVEQQMYDEYAEFVQLGFKEIGSKIQDLPVEMWDTKKLTNSWNAHLQEVKFARKSGMPLPKASAKDMLSFPADKYNKMVAWNMRMNQEQDSMFRLAMLKYCKDNPEFMTKFGHVDAASAVRKTLFDFQDLSVNERDVLRKLVPFYTFTKKNLSFQISNLQKNAVRYNNIIKSFNGMWGVLDLEDDELDKFKLENFWIPIPFKDKDGKYKAIKSSLPLGDLGEFLDTPLRRGLASTSPIVRAPFELAMNKQVFSGMPIQEFKGQKGFYLPELPKKAEFALSQLGLDVPAAQAMDIGRTLADTAKGDITNPFDFGEKLIGRTIMSTGDSERTATRNAYNELDELQNLMRYYKQEDITIFTLAEIENRQKFSGNQAILSRIQAIRAIGK